DALRSGIVAAVAVSLWVGDIVFAPVKSEITAGTTITIRGDQRRKRTGGQDVPDDQNADPDVGTTMDFRGSITPGPGATDRPGISGNDDDDTFLFNQTFLGGQTNVYGSKAPTPAGSSAPLDDGLDQFTVNQLKSMETARPLVTPDHGITVRRDTLDLDGQAGTDTYLVNTTGSMGAAVAGLANVSDYVINVLDTGANDDGVDTLTINGTGAVNPAAPSDRSGDDLFLLRKVSYLVGRPGAESPAFVDLLHGTLAQAQTHTLDPHVERINYDVNLNGRLIVNGLGGNDYFASDDTSAITTLDGGAGDDTFQIGQVFATARAPADAAPEDAFNTILTSRGYVSPDISIPTVIYGGTGDDNFQVYSNHA